MLGSDSLILVQGTAAGAAATTHAQTVSGDDPQLTNARTPTAHQASHVTGTDQIPNASPTARGLLNQLSGNTTDFVDGSNNCQPIAPQIWSVSLRSFNAIGNPTFEVDQRNVGAGLTNPANASFIQDRWSIFRSASLTGTVNTALQLVPTAPVVIPGTNFAITQAYQKFTVGTAQATLAAGDFWGISQVVEGPRWRPLSMDVHSVSILVQSSVAGTFALRLRDPTSTHSLVKLCTIPTANVWTLITLPNLPIWSGTYTAAPGNAGYILDVFLACGSAYLAAANAAWQTGDLRGVTGMSNFLATAGAIFEIAFLQHQPGASTTSIDLAFDQNLRACMRYYWKSNPYGEVAGVTTTGLAIYGFAIGAVTYARFPGVFPVRMAKAPTVVWFGSAGSGSGGRVLNDTTAADVSLSGQSGVSDMQWGTTNFAAALAGSSSFRANLSADTGW